MNEEIKFNEIIIVEQLPVIKETLEKIGKEIQAKVKIALELKCETEEEKKIVRKAKADINTYKNDFETRRKEVKNQILAPYTVFEVIYSKEIKEVLQNAYDELNKKVLVLDDQTKEDMKQECIKYFNEYLKAINIDFVKYEELDINITLSSNDKALKKAIKIALDKIVDDLALIKTQEHEEEILVEYKKDYNVSGAITTVVQRHEDIKREAELKEAKTKQTDIELEHIEEINEAIGTPTKVESEEYLNEIITDVQFTITAPRIKIRELKDYMKKEGIKYE